MMRLFKLLAGTLLIALMAVGCLPLPGLDPGGVPGKVTFHNTGLGIRSTVTVNQQKRSTSATGEFNTKLDGAGVYQWRVDSLFGTHQGSIPYNGSGRLVIELPAFSGWDPKYFDQIVVTSQGTTVRWRTGRVNVWIEAGPYRELARQALNEWEKELRGAITFREVSSSRSADLTVEYVQQVKLPDGRAVAADGLCVRRSDPGSGIILSGAIQIAERSADSIGLHRHEVGHCIGLEHSSNSGHLMHETVGRYQQITALEANLARLLYSINRSGRLSKGMALSTERHEEGYSITYMPDGTVVETLPSWLWPEESDPTLL